MSSELYDLVGIGLGPFNLSLAALAEPVPGLSCLFLDENQDFSWHPGMMVEGATLQVPVLADLVSLVDPTSRHGYLAWLRDHGRLFEFYFAEAWHVPRAEYDAYCRDVARALPSCRFDSRVTAVRHARLADGRDGFAVCYEPAGGAQRTVLAANVVLGLGSEPVVPAALRALCEEGGALIAHSAHYLHRAEWIRSAEDVTVLGSGQSGAEVVLDLLRGWHRPGRRLRWLTRSTAFEPMEYSKIGLEHFTPDYADYFHALPEPVRDQLLAAQGRLYKAVSDETLGQIRAELDRRAFPHGLTSTGVTLLPGLEAVGGRHLAGDGGAPSDRLELDFVHSRSRTACTVSTERLVLATGYAPRRPRLLAPIEALMPRDSRGRPVIGREHRVALDGSAAGLYVQNADLHTHGVGAPDLGLGAYRAATILNAVTGRPVYRLPGRTAHTSFSPAAAASADPGIRPSPPPPPEAPARARHAQRGAPGRAEAEPAAPQIPSQPEDRRERRTRTASSVSPVGLGTAGGPVARRGDGAGAGPSLGVGLGDTVGIGVGLGTGVDADTGGPDPSPGTDPDPGTDGVTVRVTGTVTGTGTEARLGTRTGDGTDGAHRAAETGPDTAGGAGPGTEADTGTAAHGADGAAPAATDLR